jgi:hypothetical protein
VCSLVYMLAIVRPVSWEEWPEDARGVFQGMCPVAGEGMVLENNVFRNVSCAPPSSGTWPEKRCKPIAGPTSSPPARPAARRSSGPTSYP